MLYAILCYHDEDVVSDWTKEEDDAVVAKRVVVTRGLAAEGRLGPVARLMPTTAAVTVRSGSEPFVIDGPFAETKDQLLGFYIVDCATFDAAIDLARQIGRVNRAPSRFVRFACSSRAASGRDRHCLDRCCIASGTAPGDRCAAPLFPRSRSGRRGIPGSVPAGAEALAGQWSAARSGHMAHPSRTERRAGRCSSPQA